MPAATERAVEGMDPRRPTSKTPGVTRSNRVILTSGVFRAGSESADLYRSISTGVNGTPMPAYASTFEPEDIWAMVHFIQSLGENQ